MPIITAKRGTKLDITLSTIGDQMGITREAVRKVQAKALLHMAEVLKVAG